MIYILYDLPIFICLCAIYAFTLTPLGDGFGRRENIPLYYKSSIYLIKK